MSNKTRARQQYSHEENYKRLTASTPMLVDFLKSELKYDPKVIKATHKHNQPISPPTRRVPYKRKGAVVAFRDKDGVIRIGWAQQNPKDHFDKYMGFEIAYNRSVPLEEVEHWIQLYSQYSEEKRSYRKKRAIFYGEGRIAEFTEAAPSPPVNCPIPQTIRPRVFAMAGQARRYFKVGFLPQTTQD